MEEEPDPTDPNVSNQEFARWLRGQPPEKQREWVSHQFSCNPIAAYDVGRRLAFRSREAREIVEKTIGLADASTIRWWVEFYASIAGLRRTLRMIDSWNASGESERASKAAYWIGFLDEAKTEQGRRIIEAMSSRSGSGD